jgi:hypothetical protein
LWCSASSAWETRGEKEKKKKKKEKKKKASRNQ